MVNCPHPDREIHARGMCRPCYTRWWRTERRDLERVYSRQHRGTLPDRILDLLEVDAPLTKFQIAAALDANENSVMVALHRLKARGLVDNTYAVRPGPGHPPGLWSLVEPVDQLAYDREGLADALRLSVMRDRRRARYQEVS